MSLNTISRTAFVNAVREVTRDPRILQVAQEQKKFACGRYFADDQEDGAVCGCVVGQFILDYAVIPAGAQVDEHNEDQFDVVLREASNAIGSTIDYRYDHGDSVEDPTGTLHMLGGAIDDTVQEAWYREHPGEDWYAIDNRILVIV